MDELQKTKQYRKEDMTSTNKDIHLRSKLLLGIDIYDCLQKTNVIVFGVGGVGSWCAESLIRTGIRHLTIVDFDTVCASNVNRQLMATTHTIGQPKVAAMKKRLLEINPEAEVTAIEGMYTEENSASFHLEKFNYVIDAIDSLPCKAHLILEATRKSHLFSSMGAALKTDPTKVRVAEFWKVQGDPLARALRNKFKKQKLFPEHKFQCVYSEQQPLTNQMELDEERGNGSLSHITGIFGFTLAGLVIDDIRTKCKATSATQNKE